MPYTDKVEWFGLGIGGDVDPSIFLPVGELKPSDDTKEYSPKEKRGKLNAKYVSKKTYSTVKIDLKGDMRLDGLLEYLMFAALGTKTSLQQGGTAAYLHTITENNVKPLLTLWKGYTTSDGTIVPKKFANAMLETLGLDIKSEGEGSLSASFKADTVDIDTTAKTPAYASDPVPFVFPEMDYKIADFGSTPVAATNMTEFSLDIKNTITEKQTSNKSIFPSVRVCSGYEVSGKAGMTFENYNILKEWLGGLTKTSMTPDYVWKNAVVDFTGPLIESTYYYKTSLTIPYFKVNDYSDPEGDLLEYNYGWEAYEKGSIPGTNDFLMKADLTSKLLAIA
jgi:hypothetical protein